jgi:hypothetical protein
MKANIPIMMVSECQINATWPKTITEHHEQNECDSKLKMLIDENKCYETHTILRDDPCMELLPTTF